MKPRIFVSSTFYDLKYVREDLAGFIRAHEFEPIMFEEGDVGYETGKPLDESCYEAMRNADMAILIIGGQHGSNASTQNSNNNEKSISVTNKEFFTSIDVGIPVFAFIDAKVNTEYDIYKTNRDKFENDPRIINFMATKDIRVFEFIRSVYALGNVSITEFHKVSDIKDFLAKQWSDMFKKYLSQLKEKKGIESIKSSISKLETLVNSISVMVDAVGKNVLKEESNEYADIKKQQKAIEICEKIADIFYKLTDENFTEINERANALINMLLDIYQIFINNGFGKGTSEYLTMNRSISIKSITSSISYIMNKYNFAGGMALSRQLTHEYLKFIYDNLADDEIMSMTKELLIKEYYKKIVRYEDKD